VRPFPSDQRPPECPEALILRTERSTDQGLVAGYLASRPIRMTGPQRRRWEEIVRHLSAGHTLQQLARSGGADPERAAAVFSGNGVLEHADTAVADPATRQRLVDALRRIDRARCRRRRRTPDEALDLWRAFVDRQYSLVESFDRGGRRMLLAIRVRGDLRALTPREQAVVQLAANGWANKRIGADLGISASTAATHLARAIHKLGYTHRAELLAQSRWSRARSSA